MKLAPATTDGSSIAIGTSTSRPLTTKLAATPNGKPKTPTTFSISLSANSGLRAVSGVPERAASSAGVRSAHSPMASARASTGFL